MGARLKNRVFISLDADEGVFFARQLEVVKTKTYDVDYPELKARQFIPVSYEAGPGAQSITYSQFDMLGMAKVISNYASDIPRVDLVGKQFTAQVRSLAAAYGYSIQDIRSAKMAGLPLEQRKANAAKRTILALEDTIAVSGDATHGLGGLLSNANVTDVPAPNNAGATSTHWSAKTAAEILADLVTLSETPVDLTKGIEEPDTILLPLTQFNLIANMQMPNINMTVMKFFLENSPFIKSIKPWNRLKLAGTGATDVAVCYKMDADKLTLEVPQDFEQLPVQEKGLEFEVNCHMRTGGVIIYKPLSIAKLYGI